MVTDATDTTECKPGVLIVDDEPANLELLVRILRSDFAVRTAENADEALAILRKQRFAAILSDQRMPGMKGTEFLAEARRLVPDTVRMILTGFSTEQDSLDAINLAGVSTFLTKPVTPETVKRAVSNAVEAYGLHEKNRELVRELERRNLELDEAKRTIELTLDERTKQLFESNRRLEQLALRDPLTGLFNHRSLHERLAEEISRQRRHGLPVSLVLADIDHFRLYNEQYSHAEGDKVIVQMANIFTNVTRGTDVIARIRSSDTITRYGGEEFAFIAGSTTKEGAVKMCERIRSVLVETVFEGQDVLPGKRMTLSFGVAAIPTDAGDKRALLQAAETALVRAKHSGRDRIEPF